MSSFEYVMVIVSIIMGLGVATLLRGIVSMIRADTPMKPGLLHTLWVSSVLIQHVVLWSLRWSGERREDWPFFVLLTFLLLPIFYYAQAELLFPPEGRDVDLNDYFIANRRGFLVLAILGNLGAAFGPLVFYGGADPLGNPVIAYLVIGVINATLMFTRSVRLHTVWAAVSLLFILGSASSLAVG